MKLQMTLVEFQCKTKLTCSYVWPPNSPWWELGFRHMRQKLVLHGGSTQRHNGGEDDEEPSCGGALAVR